MDDESSWDTFGERMAMPCEDEYMLPAAQAAPPPAAQNGMGFVVTPMDDAPPAQAPRGQQRGGPPVVWGGGPIQKFDSTGFFAEPKDTTPEAAARSAGFTALTVVALGGAGLAVGGPWGALAGVLGASTLFNGSRAQKWWGSIEPGQKHEAVVSAVIGLATGAGAAYSGYRAFQSRAEKKE